MTVAFVAAAAAAAAAAEHNSTCGLADPSPVPDCENADLGSCGNACCTVNVTGISGFHNTTELYNHLVGYLKAGGEDASFSYVTGPDSHGNNPSDDLTPYGIAWDYILQGTHTTYPGGYVDTIDIAIFSEASAAVKQQARGKSDKATSEFSLRAFNIAGIHGALGDHGQSYKSLAYMTKGAFGDDVKITKVFGCGQQQ